jgi:hypothetical protein
MSTGLLEVDDDVAVLEQEIDVVPKDPSGCSTNRTASRAAVPATIVSPLYSSVADQHSSGRFG